MAQNTLLADINEIMLGFYLNGSKSFDKEADAQLKKRMREVSDADVFAQSEKARAMAEAVQNWAKANGYKGKIKKVYWTARPKALSEALGKDVDSRKNPFDILLEFEDNKFLGISAKSTKGVGDIGFKNLGIGTVEKELRIDLKKILTKAETEAIKKYKLPESVSARKAAIRSKPAVQIQTKAIGSKVLTSIRDALFAKTKNMKQEELKKYLLRAWMDSDNSLYPRYIKVTGMGNKSPYTAKVDDPLKNEKIKAMRTSDIKLEKVGNESIGVSAGGKKIFKMRVKFESEPLASSLKFSGDPW
jgi:hypothetical protein